MQLPETHVLTPHFEENLLYYTFPALDAIPFVKHAFSTRLGGVSKGIYESMNLSFTRGDQKEAVCENYSQICKKMGVSNEQVVVSAQEHHTVIYNATAADCGRGVTRERGYTDIDGLLTDEPNVVLCTQYADCVPLLFVDPVRHVVGTSHSGWKGTVARIGAVTVDRMCADYGCQRENILAAIAPSIGPCCFEVDAPVAEAFTAMGNVDDCVHIRSHDKFDVDLWEVNRRILLSAGIRAENISVTDLCTRCHPDIFWSHRATGGERGSLAAFISMVEE